MGLPDFSPTDDDDSSIEFLDTQERSRQCAIEFQYSLLKTNHNKAKWEQNSNLIH